MGFDFQIIKDGSEVRHDSMSIAPFQFQAPMEDKIASCVWQARQAPILSHKPLPPMRNASCHLSRLRPAKRHSKVVFSSRAAEGFVDRQAMDQEDLFRRLAVALAVGLLVGLESGWQLREEAEGERTAGLRTYALTGLLGGISAAVSAASSPLLLAAALMSFTAAFTLFAWVEATTERNFSVTGVVAAILTFTHRCLRRAR